MNSPTATLSSEQFDIITALSNPANQAKIQQLLDKIAPGSTGPAGALVEPCTRERLPGLNWVPCSSNDDPIQIFCTQDIRGNLGAIYTCALGPSTQLRLIGGSAGMLRAVHQPTEPVIGEFVSILFDQDGVPIGMCVGYPNEELPEIAIQDAAEARYRANDLIEVSKAEELGFNYVLIKL